MSTGPATTVGPIVHGPLKPRAYWYWVGGLVIAAGMIGAVAWLVSGLVGLSDTVDDFERVPFVGGGTVVIDEAGGQVVYVEPGGGSFPSSMRISVVGPAGEPIATAPYGGSLTYDFGGRSGAALATFDAPVAGEYQVAAVETGSSVARELAVGPSFAGHLVRTIVVPFVIGGVGVIAGVVIIVVTAVRRSRERRRRQPQVPTYPPPRDPSGAWHGQPGQPLPPPTA